MPRQGDDDRTRSESREERGHPSEDLTNLARAALVGSGDDLDRFLKACWQYAYATAIRFGRKRQGAEDSAQDAAIVVQKLLATKPPELCPEYVGALVRTVVLRSAHEAARRRRREAIRGAPTPPEAPDVAIEAETEEWARRVRELVARLPPHLRRLVTFRYWDDMSCGQIARQVRTSRMSATRLLEQAEATLRSQLGDINGTGGETDSMGHPGPSRP